MGGNDAVLPNCVAHNVSDSANSGAKRGSFDLAEQRAKYKPDEGQRLLAAAEVCRTRVRDWAAVLPALKWRLHELLRQHGGADIEPDIEPDTICGLRDARAVRGIGLAGGRALLPDERWRIVLGLL